MVIISHKQQYLYIGLDLHKNTHTAVIIDCWNKKLGSITIENKPSAFPMLIKEVKKYAKNSLIPVFGLEDTGGNGRSLALFLIEKKYIVKEVNPALSSAERRSYPTTQKSDDWDAYCIANVLLNKLEILPNANLQDSYWTISQLVSRRSLLVKGLTAIITQLHEQLKYSYPGYTKFFSEVDGKTALAFWDKYPAPYLLENVSVNELTLYLRKSSNNACSTKKAEKILNLIKEDGYSTREYQSSRDFIIRSLVKDIQFRREEVDIIEKELEKLLKVIGYKLESMPGINTVTAASLIAEIGDISRFTSPDKLARYAGIAPVKFSSAGKGKEQKSKQGNRTLHGIFYFLAVQQVQVSKGSNIPRNPVFYEYYQRKIAEGKTKVQALVCIMRRLVNIVYGMMRTKSEYIIPILPENNVG